MDFDEKLLRRAALLSHFIKIGFFPLFLFVPRWHTGVICFNEYLTPCIGHHVVYEDYIFLLNFNNKFIFIIV